MKPTRRLLLRGLVAGALTAPLAARAQLARFSELDPPQPVETGNRIEVIEFFWYGCPHCYDLEPLLETWRRNLPADVQFRLIPAVFSDRWALDAAIYYAFDALGLVARLHRPLFDAIHRDGLRTDDEEARDRWLAKQGVDARKFEDAFGSFGVQSKVRRAAQQTIAYRIDGTPAMAVQGRYTVSAEQGGTHQGMLSAVDQLVQRVRNQRR